MPSMQRVTATWTGFAGAPGTTTLWFQGSSIIAPTAIKPFFDAFAPYIPPAVSIQVNGNGELVDPLTGEVTGTWPGAAAGVTVGTGTASTLLLTEGPMMGLDTGAYRRGHQVRGRIFLIPCLAAAVSSTGAVAAPVITAMNTAATNLISVSGSQWGVFHRPLKDYSVKPPVIKESGEFIAAPFIGCHTKVGSIRSRRD